MNLYAMVGNGMLWSYDYIGLRTKLPKGLYNIRSYTSGLPRRQIQFSQHLSSPLPPMRRQKAMPLQKYYSSGGTGDAVGNAVDLLASLLNNLFAKIKIEKAKKMCAERIKRNNVSFCCELNLFGYRVTNGWLVADIQTQLFCGHCNDNRHRMNQHKHFFQKPGSPKYIGSLYFSYYGNKPY